MKFANSKKHILASTVAFLVGGGVQNGVLAQDDAADNEHGGWLLEEVVVTASKRETNLKDTAMALSVVSGAELEVKGIVDIGSFIGRIPGVSVTQAAPLGNAVSIRGVKVTNRAGSGSAEVPTVATYLDDIPLTASNNAADIKLIDMARVEVLKGPQGTLFGQSSMGGTIRYITNQPNTEALAGGISGYVSDTAHGGSNIGMQGYLNIPLTDRLAVRGVLYQHNNDGFVDGHNIFANGQSGIFEEDVNTEDAFGGRLALKWDISDNATATMTYFYQDIDVGGSQHVTETHDTLVLFRETPPDVQPANFSNPSHQDRLQLEEKVEILSAKINVDFDAFSLTAIAATKETDTLREPDSRPYIGMSLGSLPVTVYQQEDSDTVEIRFTSNHEQGEFLSWVFGIWYENTNRTNDGTTSRLIVDEAETAVFGMPPGDYLWSENVTVGYTDETAYFGELGLHLNDNAVLTLGYRRADVGYASNIIGYNFDSFVPPPSLFGIDTGVSEDVDTYRLNLEYKLGADTLLYTQASSGYRRGGYGAGSVDGTVEPSPFESDSLWNYEVGIRTSLFNDRMTLNSVIYHIDWDDMQLRVLEQTPTGDSITRTDNVGKATIDGLELEMNFLISKCLTLGLNYAYIDAVMAEDVPRENAVKGDRLPGSTKNSYAIFLDWLSPLTPTLDLVANVTHSYMDEQVNAFGRGTAFLASQVAPDYTLTDLQVGVRDSRGLSVFLFANNVFDEVAPRSIFGQNAYQSQYYINKPRTVGLNVGYQF